jgi:hypothetical protein
MKKALIVLFMMMVASPALGQESKQRSQFYDFGEQLIDGTRQIPPVIIVDLDKRPKFERLLELKKSFLSEISETSKERALR